MPLKHGNHAAGILEQLAPLVAGQYTVERELGRGGMGRVFAATDLRIAREVAVKLLYVAAVPDAIQMPVERYLPRVVYNHLLDSYPKDRLLKILTYIAMNPEAGMVIDDISDLGIDAMVASAEELADYARDVLEAGPFEHDLVQARFRIRDGRLVSPPREFEDQFPGARGATVGIFLKQA